MNSEVSRGLPTWCSGKESISSAGDVRDVSLIPRSGRSPGGGNGDPLQYFCLENPRDRGAWQATVHGVAELDTTQRLILIPMFSSVSATCSSLLLGSIPLYKFIHSFMC